MSIPVSTSTLRTVLDHFACFEPTGNKHLVIDRNHHTRIVEASKNHSLAHIGHMVKALWSSWIADGKALASVKLQKIEKSSAK